MPRVDLAAPMAALVTELKRLPGVGAKSAQRLAFHLLGVDRAKAERLARAILSMRERIRLCTRCNNISDGDLCSICSDPRRDHGLVCVLEQPNNIMLVERTRSYAGVYHILHGALAPSRNIYPKDLMIKNLFERMKETAVKEVILATSPTTEGQATSAYLRGMLKPLPLKVTRIALGIPIGTDLEFVDEATMSESIAGRREF